MIVKYLKHMGDDLDVVNAARVSLGDESLELDARDEKLIKYLVDNEHTSPLRHCHLKVHITCPIFVARQLMRYRIGMEFNEISGRYVEFDETQHWQPETWRRGSKSIKQGSLGEEIVSPGSADHLYTLAMKHAFHYYRELLAEGVCKEQARAVLPLSMMTQLIATGSLQAWWHFYRQRSHPHAQREIQIYAHEIDTLMSERWPVTWAALKESQT